jgi:hypothetical protein
VGFAATPLGIFHHYHANAREISVPIFGLKAAGFLSSDDFIARLRSASCSKLL